MALVVDPLDLPIWAWWLDFLVVQLAMAFPQWSTEAMTPPREPFFKPGDCDGQLIRAVKISTLPSEVNDVPVISLDQANRLVEPLLEENERLKTCLFQMQNAAQDLVRQLDALKAEIEQAPVKVDFKPGEVIMIDLILAELEAKLALAKEALEYCAANDFKIEKTQNKAREALEKLK